MTSQSVFDNLPSIEELVEWAINNLSENETELSELKKSKPSDGYEVFIHQIQCDKLQEKIDETNSILSKFKPEIRDIKLGKLGIN